MNVKLLIFIALVIAGAFIWWQAQLTIPKPQSILTVLNEPPTAPAAVRASVSAYNLLEETASSAESPDVGWWLNSGAFVYKTADGWETISGPLPKGDKWQMEYEVTNPLDTDGGYYPQNILRLVTKKSWQNSEVEAYFKISAYHLSSSDNRNESNGILLMTRYLDGDNLYYAGLRVDGMAVIKKKYRGEYYILAEQSFWPGTYDKDSNPNLLPLGQWLGLHVKTTNDPLNGVDIVLSVDKGNGQWQEVLSAKDKAGDNALSSAGRVGIRTDFMDVGIKGYNLKKVK